MAKHVCKNQFVGEGARGGCFFEIGSETGSSTANLRVGWSCVIVYDGPIHITWLAELLAIVTDNTDGTPEIGMRVKAFLEKHHYGDQDKGYALMCDPEPAKG